MLYGAMHDSAILTVGKKVMRTKRRPFHTPEEDAQEFIMLFGMFWSMLTWARFAKLFAIVVLVAGFILDGFAGSVVAYVLASPLGGFAYFLRKAKGR